MSFIHGGVGRFARARGSSLFARAFNGELPKRMCAIPMSRSFASLGEKPLTGFAEQCKTVANVLNVSCLAGTDDEAQTLPLVAEESPLMVAWSIVLSQKDLLCSPNKGTIGFTSFQVAEMTYRCAE